MPTKIAELSRIERGQMQLSIAALIFCALITLPSLLRILSA